MPLLDHFRPPLRRKRGWQGFLGMWTCEVARRLNHAVLPAVAAPVDLEETYRATCESLRIQEI